MRSFVAIAVVSAFLAACAPEVGTEKWCDKMDDKPNGDWTVNEAKAYTQHCVLGNYVDEDE